MTTELETTSTEVTPAIDVEVTTGNVDAEVYTTSDISVEVNRREYSIVGDELYIPKLYSDAPAWLQNLIDQTVAAGVATAKGDLESVTGSLNTLLLELEVAKNTYTQSIISSNEIDSRINTAITTLNSSLAASDATILQIAQTAVTPEEASAIVIDGISAELANTEVGSLGATVTNLQQAIASGDSANATSIDVLTSTIEGEVDARASAINTINTYVGIDSAGASTGTGLSAYLEGSDGTVGGADSQVANNVYVDGTGAHSKFEYTSLLNINGVYYQSGFGLTTNQLSGDGSLANPYGSEFWINAEKFKFTNSAVSGQVAPFTIDASGTAPQVTFNGKVSFNNVTGAPGGGSNLLYNSAPMVANETKGWSVGWYNTGITPTLGAGFDLWRPSGGGSVFATVSGAPAIGSVFDVAQTTKVPVIGGTWYEASAYISSHRCTSYVTIAWFDSNNTYINEVGGSQVAVAAGGALVNWNRSTLLAQAPANAAKAHFYVRSAVSGTDPYCFVAFAYLGKAVQGQAVFSDWSEGTSAGVSSGEVVNDINNGNTTTINGGKITTGSITANQIAANTITANQIAANTITADKFTSTTGQSSVWTGGGLVSQNFNGNVVGSIGNPTQGFRLSSNAVGTSSDPNIYGAYIKGATLEGTTMSTTDIRVTADGYPSNYGPVLLLEVYSGNSSLTSSIFRSRSYLSGYNNKRMCSTSQVFVLQASTIGGFSAYSIVTTTCNIYISINGGSWVLLASGSGIVGIATCSITYTVDSSNDVQFMSTHSSNAVQSSSFSIQSINGQ